MSELISRDAAITALEKEIIEYANMHSCGLPPSYNTGTLGGLTEALVTIRSLPVATAQDDPRGREVVTPSALDTLLKHEKCIATLEEGMAILFDALLLNVTPKLADITREIRERNGARRR